MDIIDDTCHRVLVKAGALIEGHFLLSSGMHSPVYCEKFRVLENPDYADTLCYYIRRHFGVDIPDPAPGRSGCWIPKVELVVGPTTGGVIVAYEVARQMHLPCAFAEYDRVAACRVLRRGFKIAPQQRVLVVDDVLTTGQSVKETIDLVKAEGGVVVGAAVLVDRSIVSPSLGVDLFSCYKAPMDAYKAEECPQCAVGDPLTTPGKGSK